jgi:alkaline phosphatase
MKLRNQLLALACLLAFGAMGYLYVRTWVVQKPFGIILFVSDGMVARQLTAARLYEGGADHTLGLEAFPNVALLRNAARDFAVPDNASAATALATGVRVNHHVLAVDPQGNPLETITALARAQGRAIGIVTNGSLASATPAAFCAHAQDSRDPTAIALQLLEKFRPDVALGGGANDFLPEANSGRRKDGRDLLAAFKAAGCEIVRTKAELEDSDYQEPGGIGKRSDLPHGLIGVFAADSLAFSNDIESGSQQPSLTDMVRRAIALLQQNRQGYLLVVDASLVGTAEERNEGERAIAETIALDHAIGTAQKYAGEKSLIIAAGLHSTGGMSLNGYPLRQDRGVALLGNNAAGYPYLTWATGPNGPAPATQALPAASGEATPAPTQAPRAKSEPAAFLAPSGLNNAEDVVAAGKGAGSQKLHGFMESTAIFELLKDAL